MVRERNRDRQTDREREERNRSIKRSSKRWSAKENKVILGRCASRWKERGEDLSVQCSINKEEKGKRGTKGSGYKNRHSPPHRSPVPSPSKRRTVPCCMYCILTDYYYRAILTCTLLLLSLFLPSPPSLPHIVVVQLCCVAHGTWDTGARVENSCPRLNYSIRRNFQTTT